MLLWRDALATQRLERKMTTWQAGFIRSLTGLGRFVYRLMVIYLCGKENRACGEMLFKTIFAHIGSKQMRIHSIY